MKLHILSDLHVEFAPFDPPATDADVVLLAGDIHAGVQGIAWARATFPRQQLVYVAGNHEYYGEHWDGFMLPLRAAAARHEVHLLEDDELVLDGVRFLGSALWTDFDYFGAARRAEAMQACLGYLTDFRLIKAAPDAAAARDFAGGRPLGPGFLTPGHVRQRHLRSRAWLESRLDAPHAGPTVIVTHHLPGSGSVAERFRDDLGNAGFASDLDHLMGRAALWVHGHTHDSFDYVRGGTRVVCNPRGYPIRGRFENPNFVPGMVLEV